MELKDFSLFYSTKTNEERVKKMIIECKLLDDVRRNHFLVWICLFLSKKLIVVLQKLCSSSCRRKFLMVCMKRNILFLFVSGK
jgi:hypothetical protein